MRNFEYITGRKIEGDFLHEEATRVRSVPPQSAWRRWCLMQWVQKHGNGAIWRAGAHDARRVAPSAG
jgi:hypothetical protein